jgi:hypothetical protein
MYLLKDRTPLQLTFDYICTLVASVIWFLILPLKFQGPEFFKGCKNIHVSSCTFEHITRWHWFGMYHNLFSPEGPHYPAVMNYVLANKWEVAVAACVAIVLGILTYTILRKIYSVVTKSDSISSTEV